MLFRSVNQLTSLDVSKNTALGDLYCYENQLASLNLSGCTALKRLSCQVNQLTSLNVSGCTALRELVCYENQIKGNDMDALVEGLPNASNRRMNVIFNENEGNEMTTAQVAAAKAKGWKPYYYDGNEWKEYAGSEPSGAVAINEESFPDENFRNWLLEQDYGKDGVITDEEIAGITEIAVDSENIASLQGIEYFTALESLSCGGNVLTSLDVSQNTALKELWC